MPKFAVDLSLTTTIEIEADSAEEAAREACGFIKELEPSEAYIDGWNMEADNHVSFFADFSIESAHPDLLEDD